MDPATLFTQLDELAKTLHALDQNDALEPDTLALIADLRLAVAGEQRRVSDAIEAEWELSPEARA